MATKYKEYEESDAVKQARQNLDSLQSAGSYENRYGTQAQSAMDTLLNRQSFTYNPEADPLYRQYKQSAISGGRLAMQDAMGQASSMTGGYGNSYAQSVGQQTYNGYIQNLNDKIPELYNLAMNQYQMEGDALAQNYSLLSNAENQDYSRYRDQLSDYRYDLENAQNRYDTERQLDYNRFADERNLEYQIDRDAVSDQQWQTSYDEDKRRYDQEWAYQLEKDEKKNSGGGGSYYPGDDEGDGYSGDGEITKDDVASFYKEMVATDGHSGKNNYDFSADEYLKAAVAEGILTLREATDIREARDDTSFNEKKKTGNGGR